MTLIVCSHGVETYTKLLWLTAGICLVHVPEKCTIYLLVKYYKCEITNTWWLLRIVVTQILHVINLSFKIYFKKLTTTSGSSTLFIQILSVLENSNLQKNSQSINISLIGETYFRTQSSQARSWLLYQIVIYLY